MSEDEQELNIVKFFKPELELVCSALLYRINHSSWNQLEDEQKYKHEDILVKLLTGEIVTKINGDEHE